MTDLEDLRRDILKAVAEHVRQAHTEDWLGLIAESRDPYGSVYKSDIPRCVTCEAAAAALKVVDGAEEEQKS